MNADLNKPSATGRVTGCRNMVVPTVLDNSAHKHATLVTLRVVCETPELARSRVFIVHDMHKRRREVRYVKTIRKQ